MKLGKKNSWDNIQGEGICGGQATLLSRRWPYFLSSSSFKGGTLENLAEKMPRDSSCPLETQEVPFLSARAKLPKVR